MSEWDGRTRWRRMGDQHEAWMGNGIYAVVRPLVRHEYSRPNRKGRDVRYWIGGVVARGMSSCSCIPSPEVMVRGFGHGTETRLLADAKKTALFEAQCVGSAAVDITVRDFGLSEPVCFLGYAKKTEPDAATGRPAEPAAARSRAANIDIE